MCFPRHVLMQTLQHSNGGDDEDGGPSLPSGSSPELSLSNQFETVLISESSCSAASTTSSIELSRPVNVRSDPEVMDYWTDSQADEEVCDEEPLVAKGWWEVWNEGIILLTQCIHKQYVHINYETII